MRAHPASLSILGAVAVACGGARSKIDPPAHERAWTVDLGVPDGAQSLLVDVRFDAAKGPLGCDDDAMPFVRDVELQQPNGAWTKLAQPWSLACDGACRVRYRFALHEAATTLHDPEEVTGANGAYAATTTAWLLHPEPGDDDGRIRIHVLHGAAQFASAMRPTGPDAFEIGFSDLDVGTVTVFGDFRTKSAHVGASLVSLAVLPTGQTLADDAIAKWIFTDASAIAVDLGRFPVDRMLVVAMGNDLAGPTRGVTLGGGGASLVVRVGKDVDASKLLADDWVATHEMLHVSMPMLSREQVWLSEGLASYLEPFIRARVGMIPPEKVWRDLVEGLPQGLPAPGDEGLDVTHTWGRTYWGGALFCLLADVAIREQTHGQRSLDDVFRGANAQGGNVLQFWPTARFLDVGDAATKTHVLHDLYAKMSHAPAPVDLDALWKKLGVQVTSDAVRFDDSAPLGPLRKSMTDPLATDPRTFFRN
jgi:hypothetical protein